MSYPDATITIVVAVQVADSPTPSDRWWCYRWSGPRVDDQARRDPARETPPALLVDWLRKPGQMRVHTYQSPVPAVAWLRGEVETYAPMMSPPDPARLYRLRAALDHRDATETWHLRRCLYGPCDILCEISRHNRIAALVQPLAGGHAIEWAIIPNRAVELERRRAAVQARG